MTHVEKENLKCFIGVKFKNSQSNDVIPRLWINKWKKKSKTVFWPPTDVENLARNKTPPEDSWEAYEVTFMCHSSKCSSSSIIYE